LEYELTDYTYSLPMCKFTGQTEQRDGTQTISNVTTSKSWISVQQTLEPIQAGRVFAYYSIDITNNY